MEEETKTKWKCKECNKTLASKQKAAKHIIKFHVDKDAKETMVKVTAQVSDKDSNAAPKKKKSAYSHFSQLSNIFNNSSLVQSFSWSKKEINSDDLSAVIPPSTSQVTSAPGTAQNSVAASQPAGATMVTTNTNHDQFDPVPAPDQIEASHTEMQTVDTRQQEIPAQPSYRSDQDHVPASDSSCENQLPPQSCPISPEIQISALSSPNLRGDIIDSNSNLVPIPNSPALCLPTMPGDQLSSAEQPLNTDTLNNSSESMPEIMNIDFAS